MTVPKAYWKWHLGRLKECVVWFKRYPTPENLALIPVYQKSIRKLEMESEKKHGDILGSLKNKL